MRTTWQSSSVDRRLAAWVAAAAVAVLGLTGCSGLTCDISDDGNPAEQYEGGNTYAAGTVDGFYESSPWHSGWLHFPGGQRYDLVHHLGFEPQNVNVMLSFSENGVGEDAEADTAAQAAGNSGELQLVNDQIIRIKNDTCTEFWVRVTANGNPTKGPTATDAGDDADASDGD
jgi:hypothetical protein